MLQLLQAVAFLHSRWLVHRGAAARPPARPLACSSSSRQAGRLSSQACCNEHCCWGAGPRPRLGRCSRWGCEGTASSWPVKPVRVHGLALAGGAVRAVSPSAAAEAPTLWGCGCAGAACRPEDEQPAVHHQGRAQALRLWAGTVRRPAAALVWQASGQELLPRRTVSSAAQHNLPAASPPPPHTPPHLLLACWSPRRASPPHLLLACSRADQLPRRAVSGTLRRRPASP